MGWCRLVEGAELKSVKHKDFNLVELNQLYSTIEPKTLEFIKGKKELTKIYKNRPFS